MYPLRMIFRAAPRLTIFSSGHFSPGSSLALVSKNFRQTLTVEPPSLSKIGFSQSKRSFHLSPIRHRVKQSKDIFEKAFSWKSFAFLVIFGGGYIYVIESVKREKEAQSAKEQNKIIGQAALGGDWELTRLDGTKGGSEDLRGNFGLIYFGFTHCPDICPEEIEKAIKVVDAIDEDEKISKRLIPVFITIDPERDTAAILKDYIAEFSPKMIGYVGEPDQIREASRKFRVYYSKGPEDEDGDYIVDHSIIMYLIGPDGIFLDYYGQNKTAKEMIDSISLKMITSEIKDKKKSGVLAMFS